MKGVFLLLFVLLSILSHAQSSKTLLKQVPKAKPAKQRTQILLVGSTHFGQEGMFKNYPAADLFNTTNQQELQALHSSLSKFRPDAICIEREPEEQQTVDSLYSAYRSGQLNLTSLGSGRAESYQIGFALAKKLGHSQIYGADYYELVTNHLLSTGTGLKAFQQELDSFSIVGRKADSLFKAGVWSLRDFLRFLNTPSVLDWAYQVMFVAPLAVRTGTFKSPPVAYVDTAYVNKTYIGAEFVSIFTERELKIYSNIISIAAAKKARRILVVMGHRHAAALRKLFQNDPAYEVVDAKNYL